MPLCDWNLPFLFQHIWIPDIIIHDLVKFNKPQILNEVGALEINLQNVVYYKVRREFDKFSLKLTSLFQPRIIDLRVFSAAELFCGLINWKGFKVSPVQLVADERENIQIYFCEAITA